MESIWNKQKFLYMKNTGIKHNRKHLSIGFFVMILLMPNVNLFAQVLTGQEDAVKQQVLTIVDKYSNSCNFYGSQGVMDANTILEFKQLFVQETNVLIYNDIEPEQVSGQFLALDNYSANLQMGYPKGLLVKINAASAVLSPAYPFGKSKTYIVNAMFVKNLFGLYNGTTIHDFSATLVLQITFSMKTGTPSDFKIYNIATPETAINIVNEKRKVGIDFGPEVYMINSEFYNSFFENSNGWTYNGENNLGFGLELIIPIVPALRLGTGLRFSSFSSFAQLPYTSSTSSSLFSDADGDQYYSNIIAELNHQNYYSTLEVPAQLMLVLFPKKKFNLYLSGGILWTKTRSAEYQLSGYTITSGTYPEYNVTLENIPEYGFESRQYNEESFDWDIKSSTIMTSYGAGIMIRLGKSMALKAGYYYQGGSLGYEESSYMYKFFGANEEMWAETSGFTFSFLF